MRKSRKGKKDLSVAERLEIGILLGRGYSLRSVAGAIGRSPNTVSYEVRAGSVRGRYEPKRAHHKARVRKRYRRFQWRKLNEDTGLQAFVVAKLSAHWNPDEIAGYLRRHQHASSVSKTAIYGWLRTARGERYCELLYSRRKRVRRRKVRMARELIPHRVSLAHRPLGATNRSRYGHWEADTVVGRKGTRGGLKVACERKSRLVVAARVGSMRPREHAQAMRTIVASRVVRSLTYDNGIENREYESVGVPGYFCDPYSSWQKGGVENANKMIRRYFAKGTDFASVSQGMVDHVVSIINRKPRRILGYRSALEVAGAAGIIKHTSVLTGG